MQHELVPLLWQSVYSRLAGYEDTNDALRLARDTAMQAVVGHRALEKQAAGVMLGDFILSFKREDIPSLEVTSGVLSTNEEEGLRAEVEDLIHFHAGADESTLMTGIIPYLEEQKLWHKLAAALFRQAQGRRYPYQASVQC